MLINSNNINIKEIKASNKLDFNLNYARKPDYINFNINDIFLSFQGKNKKSHINSSNDYNDLKNLYREYENTYDDIYLLKYYKKSLNIINNNMFFPELNLNFQKDYSGVSSLSELQVESIKELSTFIKEFKKNKLPVNIQFSSYINKIDSLITRIGIDNSIKSNLIDHSLEFFVDSFMLLNKDQQHKVNNIVTYITENFDIGNNDNLKRLQLLAECFSASSIATLYESKNNLLFSKTRTENNIGQYLNQEILVAIDELKTGDLYLPRAIAIGRIRVENESNSVENKNIYISNSIGTILRQIETARIENVKIDCDFNELSESFNKDFIPGFKSETLKNDDININLVRLLLTILNDLSIENQKETVKSLTNVINISNYDQIKRIEHFVTSENFISNNDNLSTIKDLITDKLNYYRNNNIKPQLQKELKETEERFFSSDSLEGQIKSFNQLSNVFHKASADKVQLNVQSNKYLNSLNDLYNDLSKPDKANELKLFIKQLKVMYSHFSQNDQLEVRKLFFDCYNNTNSDEIRSDLFDFFRYDDKHQDKEYKKLVDIVKKINNLSISEGDEYKKARQELFSQEFHIHFQELTNPKKFLERTYIMGGLEEMPSYSSDVRDQMISNSITGMYSNLIISSELNDNIKRPSDLKIFDLIMNIYNKYNSNLDSDISKTIKTKAFNVMKFLYKNVDSQRQDQILNIAFDIVKSNQSTEVKKNAVNLLALRSVKKHNGELIDKVNEHLISQWSLKNGDGNDKKLLLTFLSKLKSSEVSKIIQNVLNSSSSDCELKLAALWAAGKDHNHRNFRSLVDTLSLDNINKRAKLSPEDFALKEMALYSLSGYSYADAKKVLLKVKNSKSELSELAGNLLFSKKLSRNNDSDIASSDKLLSNAEKRVFERLRDDFIPDYNNLSNVKKYWLNEVLVPFRFVLQEMAEKNKKLHLIKDTVTSINKDNRGFRNTYGFFTDTAGGQTSTFGDIIIPVFQFDTPSSGGFTFAHEWGHQINYHFNMHQPELSRELKTLYNNAVDNTLCLDSYAASSEQEYFAQGIAAYFTPFLPHSIRIEEGNQNTVFDHTRYDLKRKDPELFKFIDKIVHIYNQKSLVKNINLVA